MIGMNHPRAVLFLAAICAAGGSAARGDAEARLPTLQTPRSRQLDYAIFPQETVNALVEDAFVEQGLALDADALREERIRAYLDPQFLAQLHWRMGEQFGRSFGTLEYWSHGAPDPQRASLYRLERRLHLLRPYGTPVVGYEPFGGYERVRASDGALRRFFDILRHYRGPVYVRFASEMNFPSSPYSAVDDPQPYIAAFRRFKAMAPPNVRVGFSPSIDGMRRLGWERYWPGAAAVDYVGGTLYLNPGSPAEVGVTYYGEYYERLSRLARPETPFMLDEFGLERGRPEMLEQFFGAINAGRWPQLACIGLFCHERRNKKWGFTEPRNQEATLRFVAAPGSGER
jgi:hypothetical protein